MSRSGNPEHERVTREFYRRLLGRAICLVRDRDKAADLVQDTFLKYYARWPKEPPVSPGGFLFQMLANAVIDAGRQAAVEAKRFRPLVEDDIAIPEEMVRLIDRIEVEQLNRAVDSLSPLHARLLRAKYWEGKSGETIARDEGLERQRVYRLLLDGREMLRPALLAFLDGAE